ncbi:MAG TPA: type IV secretion system protein VirB10 [Povalibacter sp.]|uniref:type IV secretion system protein VirB10 n=1 Tax=Povalibacter sp. TaxID=1962978 RepID=UPI002BE5B664|nr:type IV secretion system protein VirB10 [Povalibacter sp.]HMN43833.1 type IV secretion system protein VirB10 [Povalibacter sp.]
MNTSDPQQEHQEPPRHEETRGTIEESIIVGERGIPSVNRTRSLNSKASHVLAMGLMGAIGLGMLTWYFANAAARHARQQASARSSGEEKAKAEMVLPALGRVEPPPVLERVLGPEPELPPPNEAWVAPRPASTQSAAVEAAPGQAKSPAQLALQRQLSGPVFVAHREALSEAAQQGAGGRVSAMEQGNARGLDEWFASTVTPAALAGVLPSSRLLLPKGAFIDCTLETALDSTLPGMATCVTASDTFSVDGGVVLLERGTKLVGETRGSVRQGQARIFVLWTQARTPSGVVVELASPGTDELGRAGLPGEVDRHFGERFGAAMLISLIDGVVQTAVQSSMEGAAVIYNPSTSQDILTEVLRSTVNIPPTVRKQQGDRIQVLVARDLDFRAVYRLRAAATEGR